MIVARKENYRQFITSCLQTMVKLFNQVPDQKVKLQTEESIAVVILQIEAEWAIVQIEFAAVGHLQTKWTIQFVKQVVIQTVL